MRDENDILFNEYSLDFFGFLRLFFDGSGADSGSGTGGALSSLSSFFGSLVDFIETFWSVFVVFSWLLSALLIFGIIYAYMRASQLGDIESEGIANNERLYAELHGTNTTNKRWDTVEKHVATNNPNDWKLAIIEADIMLDEMLASAGYAGNTIGDKLKSASPQTFQTLDQAWTAHKVRNQIAHGGVDFVLTSKLAQETVTQYRMVFQEFKVI